MDFPPEKPSVPRAYCPGCEPHADVLREMLDVQWCAAHVPDRDGTDDLRVNAEAILSGTAEAGGGDNRAWCELIHRGNGSREPVPAVFSDLD